MRETLPINLAIFARNEAANLKDLTQALGKESTYWSSLTLVVDGANDGTDHLARQLAEDFKGVRALTSSQAKGKWPAIQEFCSLYRENIRSSGVVLLSADLKVPEGFVEEIAKTAQTKPGPMVLGARVVPLNLPKKFGKVVHVLWAIHHAAALLRPRAGEVLFFKGEFPNLSKDLVVDEPAIYQEVRRQGGEVIYSKNLWVMNLGPSSYQEYLSRRRSIAAGYLQLRKIGLGEHYSPKENLKLLGKILKWMVVGSPVGRFPVLQACFLELWARSLGMMDFYRGRLSQHWVPAPSTKSFSGEVLTPEEAKSLQEAFFSPLQ